jgi:plasmid stabilization system protein ParE
MTRQKLEFHEEASAELEAAYHWYAERAPEAAAAFADEIDYAVRAIIRAPDTWPPYHGATRRYLLHHYPYAIIYNQAQSTVRVLAVAHTSRRPGYWQSRA